MKNKKQTFLIIMAKTTLIMLLLTGCATAKGKLVDIDGLVSIARETKGTQSSIKEGTQVKELDTLLTESGASAWLTVNENTSIMLSEKSILKPLCLQKNYAFQLIDGEILARIDMPLKVYETFEIYIGSILVSVRGTVFGVKIENEGEMRLNVYQGSVAVCEQDGSELIHVTRGKSVIIDQESAELKGAVKEIDYKLLSEKIAKYVADYERESKNVQKEQVTQQSPNEQPQETQPNLPSQNTDIDGQPSEQDNAEANAQPQQDPAQKPPETHQESGTESSPEPERENPEENPELSSVKDETTGYIMNGEIGVRFKYMYDGNEFKPYADIYWPALGEVYIKWQLYDSSGRAGTESGEIRGEGVGLDIENALLDIRSPTGDNLHPSGSTIKLTPYYKSEETGESIPNVPIVMDLPYLEVKNEEIEGKSRAVISTNIGFYFEHSYESLSETQEESGKTRVRGELLPLEGTQTPIVIDVISE